MVPVITKLPPDMFQGYGAQFVKIGFEYWANLANAQEAYVAWRVDGVQGHRVGAVAVGPDQGVGQRLIQKELMSIVSNLGILREFFWDGGGIRCADCLCS